MGLFGDNIGDKKVMKKPMYRISRDSKLRKGSYAKEKVEHVYHWCGNCIGQGYFSYIGEDGSFQERSGRQKCPTCDGIGKIWSQTPYDSEHRFIEKGIGGNVKIDLLNPVNPRKSRIVEPVSASILNAGCSRGHAWRLTHRGGDKKYPRGFFKCATCGETKTEENF